MKDTPVLRLPTWARGGNNVHTFRDKILLIIIMAAHSLLTRLQLSNHVVDVNKTLLKDGLVLLGCF